MAQHIGRGQVFYAFSPQLVPSGRVKQSEEFVLETFDCFQDQLKSEADLVDGLDWGHINPATGPVFIEGVKAGDVVCFEILDVKVKGPSVMVTIPGEGVLGDLIQKMETAMLPIRDGKVTFKERLEIRIKPMIGVIGVAPAAGEIPTGTPGPHGGNMDCTLIGKGARLYLTSAVDGALFGCGDLHAVMGDGEIVVCGAEAAGEVRLRANVRSLPGLPTPFLETEDLVVTIASAETLDEACSLATHHMATFLTVMAGLPLNDAGMLMSLVGSLKVCQVVDPKKTARFEFPKSALASYHYPLD
jgi:amidase